MQQFVKTSKVFNKRKALYRMLSDLESRVEPYTEVLEFFKGEAEILFAVVLQNFLQRKNRNRTDAIKENKYVEIETLV